MHGIKLEQAWLALEENYLDCLDCKEQFSKLLKSTAKVREPVVLLDKLRSLPIHLPELD